MRLSSVVFLVLSLRFGLAVCGGAQQRKAAAPSAPQVSPEVHSDGSVSFRLRAPNAKEVYLAREGAEQQAMQKDSEGVWSLTTTPLAPDYYGYSFVADGVRLIDPSNPLLTPNLLATENAVHVPGPWSLPWELNDVPHGEIHHHFYKSSVAGDERDYYVYTPPGYNPKSHQSYPVLYLLHGYSDAADAWTSVGKANFILDSLIASGKAKPMIVVMPLGYGTMAVLNPGRNPTISEQSYELYQKALLTEVMPQIEANYHVSKKREDRAIAGLSMGGYGALLFTLRRPTLFGFAASISGAFSGPSGIDEVMPQLKPSIDQAYGSSGSATRKENDLDSLIAAADPRTIPYLFIECGTADPLLPSNRHLVAELSEYKLQYEYHELPGNHTWSFWDNSLSPMLAELARQLHLPPVAFAAHASSSH